MVSYSLSRLLERARTRFQAAAGWFDVDGRIYQRDLAGDYLLHTARAGAQMNDAGQRLSSLTSDRRAGAAARECRRRLRHALGPHEPRRRRDGQTAGRALAPCFTAMDERSRRCLEE